jgi:hypothetical protein
MTRNTIYLLGIWSVVVLFLLVALVIPLSLGFGVAIWHGEWETLTELSVMLAVVIVITAALVIGIRIYQRGRIRRLFQSPSPDALLRSHRIPTVPHGDAIRAQGLANVCILYGHFGEARAYLRSVKWENRPPFIIALRKVAEALLCYFDTRDYQEGLAIAKSSQHLAQVPQAIPGAATSHAAYDAHVQIGEVLLGQCTTSTIEALENHYRKLPLLGKLLVAWALIKAYRNSNNLQRANELQEFIRKSAPHCSALQSP